MLYFAFAIFFALNFSIWFMLPAFLLKSITKPVRKKKDKSIKNDCIVYGVLTTIYGISYILFFRYFSLAIDNAISSNTATSYLTVEINNLSIVVVFFMIISILQGVFTFILAKKLFRIKEYNMGYTIISITGLFNIVTYFFSNTVLKLDLYSFEVERYVLNMIMKIDYQLLLFLFPTLVFTNFALSFIEEK